MARITKDTVLKVKRLKRLYPDKTNQEIGKMVNPRISNTSVSSISRGRYDHMLGDKMAVKVKHLRTHKPEDIIAADKLIRDNPNIPIHEIAKMNDCKVSDKVLYRISVGVYDDIINQYNENAAKNTRSLFQDKEYREAMDELHDIIYCKPTKADVQPYVEDNLVKCLKCGSENVSIVDVLVSKGKTAKLKCGSCDQVMYLSTDDWSKDGRRYERRMW